MIKNLIIMLMVFSLLSSAWCCGPAVSFKQVQQQQVQVNNNNNNNTPPAEPVPFEVAIKESLDNFNSVENQALVDELRESFDLPIFSGDSNESREERNQKQEDAVNLADNLKDSIVNVLNQANAQVDQFNNEKPAGANEALVQSFNAQSNNLVKDFLKDVANKVQQSLGTNVDPNLAAGQFVNPVTGEVFTETNDPLALIDGLNANNQPFNDSKVLTVNELLQQIGFNENELVQDITRLRQSVLNDINTASTLSQNSNSAFTLNANDFDLDAGYEENFNLRLDVINPIDLPGVTNSGFDRSQSNIVRMIQALVDRFPGTTLASDLGFFLSFLPVSSEQVVQDSLTPGENIFATAETRLSDLQNQNFSSDRPHQNFDPNNDLFSTSSFVLSNNGRLIGIDNNDPNAQQNIGGRFIERQNRVEVQINASSDIAPIEPNQLGNDNTSFNTRNFGGSPGNFTAIEITVGNTTYALQDHLFTSPIVLDMDGDGELQASGGVYLPHLYKNGRIAEFDINGDQFMDLTEWVGENDGLLIQYDPTKPVDGRQLFGDAQGYLDGYEKLRILDVNNDKILNGEELSSLSIWQDKNLNAKVDAGEITSLKDLNITELGVEDNNYLSYFVMNGNKLKMWDWYPCTFRVKKKK